MNYIKIFQNPQALTVSVVNTYYEDQLMHIFLDNFHQSRTFTAQIASHQEELRIEETFNDQKSISIKSLKTYYLYLDSS